MDGCDHIIGLYIHDDDDPSISSDCIDTVDLRLPDDPFHSDGCTHTVDLFTWSFISIWLRPYCGFMFCYMTGISYMYMYICT